ncbi:HD domain-containing protein [Pseudomonas indica]|uniref:5'-deoxynucleotidase n=1 Tax=Pseudomonas indica TaxID=137658 RepID=A0A1G9CQF2_9PSED|nr:HD domain-containing protein [Pseudomonas indica]SDK53695.1 putative hydrolases of HD superfamily [Pseudomonas indica]
MNSEALDGILGFLKQAEQLKNVLRSSHTSQGRPESTAEHSWRLCLMAMMLEDDFPEIDFARLVKICIIHDLGEAISGDIPAIQQVGLPDKTAQEREDLLTLLQPLPDAQRAKILDLWDDYSEARSPEARLAKALDKLETIMQHNQGRNPPDFDYAFNLGYGQRYTGYNDLTQRIRTILDEETAAHARRQGTN